MRLKWDVRDTVPFQVWGFMPPALWHRNRVTKYRCVCVSLRFTTPLKPSDVIMQAHGEVSDCDTQGFCKLSKLSHPVHRKATKCQSTDSCVWKVYCSFSLIWRHRSAKTLSPTQLNNLQWYWIRRLQGQFHSGLITCTHTYTQKRSVKSRLSQAGCTDSNEYYRTCYKTRGCVSLLSSNINE